MNIRFLTTNFIPIVPILILFVAMLFFYLLFTNRKKQIALQHYNQYIPELNSMIEQVLSNQHGYNNILNSICSLPYIIDDYNTLFESLNNHIDNLHNTIIPSKFLLLENKLLAGLIFQKYCNANDKGIHMYVNIINPICKSKANEFEIVDSAGIIIDNALENSIRNNNIYITISQSDSKTDFRFHLIVENPGPAVNDDFIKNIFTKGYTTKKSDTQKQKHGIKSDTQKHGIGLQILKKTVNKYNGSISVYNTYRNSEGKTFIKNTIGTQRYLCMDIII